MASRGVVGVIVLSAVPLLCLELRRGIPELGIKDLILLCGRIFLMLALLTLIISVTSSWLTSFTSSQVYLQEDEEKNDKRRKLVRIKQQEAQLEKAGRYVEDILQPRQQMRWRRLEERFCRMTGGTWKLSHGHKLGGEEDVVLETAASGTPDGSSASVAAGSQKLPLTGASPPEEQPVVAEVPNLPEEPSETAEQVVTVALRCPGGSVLRRRFLKSCSSQVLSDWMRETGHPPSLYSLSASFPRRSLDVEGGRSLNDVGITVDTVLNVEEKEQS
ncbi:UBX domain-containing protein 8 isoform X4 [Tupaia chinensis]|uniref:UBX domain-containing protein 8 isoform X3 n=1 Tax=Tupaia chinensis TaxID=246437 RepID=UPI0003C90600|nr:UBX domain-containing protein 8 isoform X3 [Tupaia chinensis]XP_006167247.1 UBX domain-containing protein 8 isoform X4 [Tupaia chinensis]